MMSELEEKKQVIRPLPKCIICKHKKVQVCTKCGFDQWCRVCIVVKKHECDGLVAPPNSPKSDQRDYILRAENNNMKFEIEVLKQKLADYESRFKQMSFLNTTHIQAQEDKLIELKKAYDERLREIEEEYRAEAKENDEYTTRLTMDFRRVQDELADMQKQYKAELDQEKEEQSVEKAKEKVEETKKKLKKVISKKKKKPLAMKKPDVVANIRKDNIA